MSAAGPRLPVSLPEATHGGHERASATPTREAVARPHAHRATGEAAAAPSPTKLRDVQLWMLDAITSAEEPRVDGVITRGPRLDAVGRFEVYRSGYLARLVECLADDYPTLAQALGEARFEALATAYIARHPSRGPSLNPFGRHMSAFCREAPDLDDVRGFAADLAALEWALVEIVHEAIAPALDLDMLKAVPVDRWPGARLPKSGALRLLRFDYPVNAFYQACRADDATPEIPAMSASATAVYRHRLSLWRMDLTPAMARVLDALFAGHTLGEALDAIQVDADEAARAEAETSVMVWFREWVSSGFFARVEV